MAKKKSKSIPKKSASKAKASKKSKSVKISKKVKPVKKTSSASKKPEAKKPFEWNVKESDVIGKITDEELLDAWYKLREFAAGLGEPQRIYASPLAIMFARKICWCFVRPKKKYLELSMFLPRKLDGAVIAQISSTKEKYCNVLRIVHSDQIEEPLTDWLREAYEFAPKMK